MKKLVGLLVIMFVLSSSINAQNFRKGGNNNSQFTPEQTATLQAKKMALNLDLTEKQQKAVYKIMKKNSEERVNIREERQSNRQKGTTLTQDQRYDLANTRVDRQIAYKAEMKNILSQEQFDKWQLTRKGFGNNKGRMSEGNNRRSGNCTYNDGPNNSNRGNRNKI